MNVHAATNAFGVRAVKTILGISVASIGWDQAISLLTQLLRERRFTKISFLNAHNANIATDDPAFAEVLEDFLVLPDGVGVDMAVRLGR